MKWLCLGNPSWAVGIVEAKVAGLRTAFEWWMIWWGYIQEHFVLLNQTLMAFHTNFMANDVIYLFPYCMPSLVEGWAFGIPIADDFTPSFMSSIPPYREDCSRHRIIGLPIQSHRYLQPPIHPWMYTMMVFPPALCKRQIPRGGAERETDWLNKRTGCFWAVYS